MERVDRASVATFLAPAPLVRAGEVELDADVAHHMRVRRLATGADVQLLDGAGGVGWGTLRRLAKASAVVEVDSVERRAPPPPVHLLVPVADRDRSLWLAEKCAELGVASWRPVRWRRSQGVASRGESDAFQARVRARMAAALVQSEGAWLPELVAPAAPAAALDALAALRGAARLVLDPDGPPLQVALEGEPPSAVALALGPEGGFERDERDALTAAGFHLAALPGGILRFETAGVVAVALTLAALQRGAGGSDGR